MWTSFKNKRPIIGTNILISDGEKVALVEWHLKSKRHFENESSPEYFETCFSDEDLENDVCQDLKMATHWCYPSQIMVKDQYGVLI